MSDQTNLELARTIYDRFSRNDFAGALELTTEDWEGVLNHAGMTFQGKEGFNQFMQGFKGAFPDLIIQVQNQVSHGNQIVSELTARGTHTGPLMTPAGIVPPTGKIVDFTVCEVLELREGKVAKLRNYQDGASIMRQLGLMPSPNGL